MVIEHGTRRLAHVNVTANPTASWILQQLREAIGVEDGYHYLPHDRDQLFARGLDTSTKNLGLRVLRLSVRSPMANAVCERLIGAIGRECRDWPISMSQQYLRTTLRSWSDDYNRARPYRFVGSGVPDPHRTYPAPLDRKSRHRLGTTLWISLRSVLGGLHHEHPLLPALPWSNNCGPQDRD